MSSKQLIDHLLSGKSADYLVDSLIEELPPLPALRSSIQRDLPAEAKVDLDGSIVYITHNDKDELNESIHFLEKVYPELEFVVK